MSNPDSNNRNIQLLLHVIEGVNRTLELKSLLSKSMQSAQRLMKAEASSLMLIDKMTGELNVSIPEGPVGSKIKGLTIPKGKGISSWVLENKQPFFSNNPEKSEKFWKDLSDDFKTKNILCVPLIDSEGSAMGVLQVLNKEDGLKFTDGDVGIMEMFASHVAISIEKVREVDEFKKKAENREERLKKVNKELAQDLGLISTFLRIEAENMDLKEANESLKSACARVLSASNGHYLFQDEEKLNKIELRSFINELFAHTSAIFSDDDRVIQMLLEIGKFEMEPEKAISMGMLINEIFILLFRFAFDDKTRGEIRIQSSRDKEKGILALEISDNGKGIDVDQIEQQFGSDFTRVITTMAERIEADVSICENHITGSTITVKCPISLPVG